MDKKVLIGIVTIAAVAGGIVWLNTEKMEQPVLEEETILRIGGSTTIYPVARSAAEYYMDKNPEVIITVSESSTGGGVKRLLSGEIDIADCTRLPKEDEYEFTREKGIDFEVTRIGVDAVAIIIHPNKHEFVQELTQPQVLGIFFEGTITDWSQLSPVLSGKINVYVRDPHESGTATLFANRVTGSDKTSYVSTARDVHITPLVVPTLAEDPNGIAYTPIKWVGGQARVVAYGKSTDKTRIPTLESIKDSSYPLVRNMYMVTLGKPRGLSKAFIGFILSQEGQDLLEKEGFVGISDIDG